MSDHIVLDAEVLRAQSTQMQKLSSDYSDLFKAVHKSLNQINSSFSSKMSKEFIVKINTAQKSFQSIVQSMQNGAAAAMLGVEAFNETGSVNMSDMLEDVTEKAGLSKFIDSIHTGFPDSVKEAVNGFLKNAGIDGKHIIPILEKIDSADYSEVLKAYDWASGKAAHYLAGGPLKDLIGKFPESAPKFLVEQGLGAYEKTISSVLYHIPRDIGDIYHSVLQDDTTTHDAANLFKQVLWHWGGAPLEGALNQAIEEAPDETIDYLQNQGANPNSGVSILSHAIGGLLSEITNDDSWREAYSIFDKDMGKGLVEAFDDIAGSGADNANELMDNIGLHSIFK